MARRRRVRQSTWLPPGWLLEVVLEEQGRLVLVARRGELRAACGIVNTRVDPLMAEPTMGALLITADRAWAIHRENSGDSGATIRGGA